MNNQITHIRPDELGRIIRTITEALRMHDLWRDDLLRILACRLKPTEAFLAESGHRHCAFGHWFYSEGNESLRQTPAFDEIGTLHRLMHIAARDLCRKYASQHGNISVADFDALLAKMINFRSALEGVRDRVAHTLQSQDRYVASHDSLTTLVNRSEFRRRLELSIAQAKRDNTMLAVLFIDLDNFKAVNDKQGHAVGDLLLKEMGQRLVACVREIDTTARLGGDEFAAILNHIPTKQVSLVCQRIVEELSLPVRIEDNDNFVSCSVGISLFPQDGSDECTLLKHADAAMYRAKNLGKNQFQYFADLKVE